MARVVLITAAPHDPATGLVVPQYLAGGGTRRHYLYQGRAWAAGVAARPRFRAAIGFDAGGWTGGVVPTTGTVRFAPSTAAALDRLADLYWEGAAIRVETGIEPVDDAEPVWSTALVGTVAGHSAADGFLTLTIGDFGVALARPVLAAGFAGTGGIEGAAVAAGRPKRRSWGRVWNVEGRVFDPADTLYEFGDPACPAAAMPALRDIGRFADPAPAVLAWQGSIAATIAALRASSPARGSGVVAPSIQMAKWWTQPMLLTADIHGEIGAGYVETAPEIAARIVGPATAIDDLAAAVAIRGDAVGLHVADANETIAQALDRLLLGVSLFPHVRPTGTIALRDFRWNDPVETLDVRGRARVRTYPPVATRRLGWQRAQRIHGDGELASTIIGAPVTWPDVTDPTGTKPADNATNSADPESPFGSLLTVGEAIKLIDAIGVDSAEGLRLIAAARADLQAKLDAANASLVVAHGEIAAIEAAAGVAAAAAQATADRLRDAMKAQLSGQLLEQQRKARVDFLTHINGVRVGTVVVQEIRERTEGQTAIVETIAIIGAKNDAGTAFILDSAKVLVGPGQSLAERFAQIDAGFVTADGRLGAAVSTLTRAVADETAARATAITSLSASVDTRIGAASAALVVSIGEAAATEAGARTTEIARARSDFAAGLATANADIVTARETAASATGALTRTVNDLKASLVAEDARIDARVTVTFQAVVDETSARTQAITALQASYDGALSLHNARITSTDTVLASEIQSRGEQDTAITTYFQGVANDTNARVTNAFTAISDEASARASAITALSTSFTGQLGAASAATTIAYTAAIADERSARTTALTEQRAEYRGALGTVTTAISTVEQAIAEETSARASAISTLDAEYGGALGNVSASISELRQAIADEAGARAGDITSVRASIGDVSGEVLQLREVIVDPQGNVTAKGVFALRADGKTVGIVTTNDGQIGTIDMLFDSYTFRRPNGTALLANVGDVLYLGNVVVDTLASNTAMVPARSSASVAVPGQWATDADVTTDDSAKQELRSATIYMPKAGWIEASFSGKQSFSSVDTGWELVLDWYGRGAIEESRVGGRAPQDGIQTSGFVYVTEPGAYTIRALWQGRTNVSFVGRTLFLKGFPGTS